MPSQSECLAIVNGCKALAKAAKSLNALSSQLLANNSAQSIDWNSLPEGWINSDGDIEGTDVSPAEVSNVIGSLSTFQTFYSNGHNGNFEKLSPPIV